MPAYHSRYRPACKLHRRDACTAQPTSSPLVPFAFPCHPACSSATLAVGGGSEGKSFRLGANAGDGERRGNRASRLAPGKTPLPTCGGALRALYPLLMRLSMAPFRRVIDSESRRSRYGEHENIAMCTCLCIVCGLCILTRNGTSGIETRRYD